ncbi:MAG TPA: four helix bundle protein [Flavisolibacter sp.]|jgi:four helix bundle protein|nr:four helix bundle protein [Flavisolibacter sp.]
MPKTAGYKNLEVYNLSKRLVIACYELTHELPSEEKTNFTRYIRTAALSLHVNIAQGVFLKSKKRKKFVRAAKNALIIIDAATEILVELNFATQDQIDVITSLSSSCYQSLDGL